MNKAEISKILFIIQNSYSNFKPDNMEATVELWNEMLGDLDYNSVALAVKTYILEPHDFAPGIGDIRKRVVKISTPKELDASEAWDLVYKGIKNGIYKSQETFDSLPKAVQRAIGSANYFYNAGTDTEFNAGVYESNFRRNYEVALKQKEEFLTASPDIKALIERTGACLTLEGKRQNLLNTEKNSVNALGVSNNLQIEEK